MYWLLMIYNHYYMAHYSPIWTVRNATHILLFQWERESILNNYFKGYCVCVCVGGGGGRGMLVSIIQVITSILMLRFQFPAFSVAKHAVTYK